MNSWVLISSTEICKILSLVKGNNVAITLNLDITITSLQPAFHCNVELSACCKILAVAWMVDCLQDALAG